jgi:TolB-like protein/Flp pilus assembly protein TadD
MTGAPKAVFLSYASQDAEAAGRICAALRHAGVEVWFDQSELRGGDAWDQKIRREIHDCSLFVPIVSQHTQDRLEGYFRLEWKLAVDRSHTMAIERPFLVPVVVDGTTDQEAIVPDSFRAVQWTRLLRGETPPEFVTRVARLLSSDHSTPELVRPAPRIEPVVSSGPIAHQFIARRPLALWLALGLTIAAIGYYGVDRFLSRHGAHAGTALVPASPSEASAKPEKSIAVLAFVDLSQKRDQQYFADGMAEEIVDLLVRIPHLRVIGHISSFQFKGSDGDLRAIGEKLGAAYIVEGSVRTAGSRMRVSAQLVDARSGVHKWSQTVDRDLGDVLVLQQEIASGIARALQLAVGVDEAPERRHLQSPEAYLLYLRGRSALDRFDRDSLREAESDFEQALALDPSFLPAAESLALAHVAQAVNQFVPSRVAWEHAREAAEAALRIDPQSASAHGVLGLLHAQYEFDWDAADAEFKKAFALNARSADTLHYAAQLAFARGNHDDAMGRINASLSVDPLDPYTHQTHGWLRYLAGDLAGAELALHRSLEISPTLSSTHLMLGEVLFAGGQREAALTEMAAETPDGGRYPGLAVVYFALGRRADSDAALAQATREYGELWPYGVAEAHAYRGERDQAFEWLSKSYDARDPDLMFVKDDPLIASLHSDPRFKALLRKLHLPE